MKLPPPFLDIGFYRSDEKTVLGDLLRALISLGASFTGEAWGHTGSEALEPFNSPTDYMQYPLELSSLDDLARLECDRNLRLTEVSMLNASGRNERWHEIVSYCAVRTPGSSHAVSIWTSAELWSTPPKATPNARTRRAGDAVYRRFLELIAAVRPAYAGLTCEEALHCPSDYLRDPRTCAFRTFYLERSFLGEERWSRVLKLVPPDQYYREAVADGLYLSCEHDFNPRRMNVPFLASEMTSNKIASIIGETAKDRPIPMYFKSWDA